MKSKPIGIFDSGVGGLTVCKAIHDLMPNENIIYFGDTARFPYGTRSQETIIDYSREICDYLITQNVKMIVTACNTASASALDTLRNEYNIPIIGVIESGAKAACKKLENISNQVGVIATRATVKSNSYAKAIANIDNSIKVSQQHATLFVSITEEGLTDSKIAQLTSKEYIESMYQDGIRHLILGCTHFPLLKKTILSVYPDIVLIDTGEEIAIEVESILKDNDLLNNEKAIGSINLYASDVTENLNRLKTIFFTNNNTEIKKIILSNR